MKKAIKGSAVVLCVALVFAMTAVVGFANNHSDTKWNFYVTYADSKTEERQKEDSSAMYVKYESGDHDVLHTAAYAGNTNVTTTADKFVSISRYEEVFVPNYGLSVNGGWVSAHFSSLGWSKVGNASGLWSPDSV